MECVRVLIADDHHLFREGLRSLLESIPEEFEVVGEATNGEEAIVRASDLKPDVALVDIEMPGLDGIEATRRILEANPNVSIVVCTMHEANELVFAAMRAGARGYILKTTSDYSEMLRVIRAVASGEAHFGPEIAKRLMGFFSDPKPAPPQTFPELSDREREILNFIAQGNDHRDAAESLPDAAEELSVHTSQIFRKLRVADRAQAIMRAREAGLGQGDA